MARPTRLERRYARNRLDGGFDAFEDAAVDAFRVVGHNAGVEGCVWVDPYAASVLEPGARQPFGC